MTRARDKASAVVANFASTGIDDNADANAITIDSSENIGIGTTSPSELVHIKGASGAATDVQIQGGDDTNSVRLFMGGSTNRLNGRIVYDVANDAMAVSTGGNERLRINSDGKLLINATSSNTPDLLQIESPASGGGYGIQIRRNDNNTDQQVGSIKFGNTSDSDLGQIAVKTDGAANSGAILFLTASAGTTAERMRLEKDGELLIGTSSASGAEKLSLKFNRVPHTGITTENTNGTSSTSHMLFKNPNGGVGSIRTSGSSTAFNTTSDHRLKENVADMTGAIDRVKQLAPKRFNFIADADTTIDGFLAHEAQTVVPEAVHGEHNEVDDDGNAVMQGIDQAKLVPLLTGALKEAIAKIQTLETQRADLEARVTALENAE